MANVAEDRPPDGPFRRILVGWDGNDTSRHAFELAARLARCCGAELLALSVARIPDHAETRAEKEESIAAARRYYAARLAPLERVARNTGIAFRHEVVPSQQRPEAIIEYARAHACDLIVLGSHKVGGGFARLLSGMVGEAVARAAPCPVLLVPKADG